MLRKPKRRPTPSLWASPKPFGIGEQRPNNDREVLRAGWENRDRAAYAWRILSQGGCDGCALGTTGLRDWTLDGIHLCNVRLRLLRLNTMGALDPALLADAEALAGRSSAELPGLGRLPYPMLRRAGEPGFRRIGWDEALDVAADRIRASGPDRLGFYLTSRGMTNEGYYGAQKAARAIGTNSIDNAARVCHSPSTFGLKEALGVAATTCSYADWIGTDLVVFIGSNVANNQPVTTKYLHLAKKAGTKVAVVNPYREPGMDRYWIPSNLESATLRDQDLRPLLPAQRRRRRRFSERRDEGDDRARPARRALRRRAHRRLRPARRRAARDRVGAARGHRGDPPRGDRGLRRPGRRGRASRVRVEHGSDPARARRGQRARDRQPRSGEGLRRPRGLRADADPGPLRSTGGRRDGLLCDRVPRRARGRCRQRAPAVGAVGLRRPRDAGPNGARDARRRPARRARRAVLGRGELPRGPAEPEHVREALARIPLRVHMDLVVSSQMLVDPADVVLLLPAATRYETRGGVTETSTERRVIFSPEIRGPRVGEARPEWEVLCDLAARARPEVADRIAFSGTAAIREEIADVVPPYRGIERLRRQGDEFQYGGAHLCAGWEFPTADGRAHFSAVGIPKPIPDDGRLALSTRRGKQFNSMVQERSDSLTGAVRDAVLISAADAERLGIADGAEVVVRSDAGEMRGHARLAAIAPGNLQVHWPEGNALISGRRRSPDARIPDYNARVTVECLSKAAPPRAPGPAAS